MDNVMGMFVMVFCVLSVRDIFFKPRGGDVEAIEDDPIEQKKSIPDTHFGNIAAGPVIKIEYWYE